MCNVYKQKNVNLHIFIQEAAGRMDRGYKHWMISVTHLTTVTREQVRRVCGALRDATMATVCVILLHLSSTVKLACAYVVRLSINYRIID